MDTVNKIVSLICDCFLILGVVSSSKLRVVQSEDWQLICMCALSKLADVCQRVISGEILVQELRTISLKESQMSKLCIAAAEPTKQKDNGKKSSQAEDFPPYDTVKTHLDVRLKELNYFMTYRDQLRKFLHVCASVALSGKVFLFVYILMILVWYSYLC